MEQDLAVIKNLAKEVKRVIVSGPSKLEKIVQIDGKIVLSNENSMIDTEKIDLYDSGKVSPQAVNLEKLTGNRRVVEALMEMKKRKETAFFPGTLMRDYGEFFLPVMPIIVDGEIATERVKQTGIAYVDDYPALAERLLGKGYAEKVREFKGPDFEGPIQEVKDLLKEIVARKRTDSMASVNIGEWNILPVICNEIYLIPNLYRGKKVNLILHSCSNLFESKEQRENTYRRFFEAMKEKGLVGDESFLATAESGDLDERYHPFIGSFAFEKGRLIEI